MADHIIASIGQHCFWGASATFDAVEALQNAINTIDDSATNETTPINILLLHPGDIRHIIETISRRRRHRRGIDALRPLHFYLMEQPCEVLARDILLLQLLTDFEVPIRQRATIFLEIYGNCRVQERTSRYIEQMARPLHTIATSGTHLNLVDLSHLRYRERDQLEAIFKTYRHHSVYDIVSYREHRMRGLYAERYDSRKGLFDWDYQYSYRPSVSIIHHKLYREFRESGIAFEFGDQTYTCANKTLMSYHAGTMKRGKDAGHLKEVLGYWGDIVLSPYFAFGIDCERSNSHAEGLFEIVNKDTGTEQHRHHTVEVALYSLFSMLYEIEFASVYRMTVAHDVYSGLGVESGRDKRSLPKEENLQSIKEENEEQEEAEEVEPAITTSVTDAADMSEDELAKELRRAENIVEAFRDVKVLPRQYFMYDTVQIFPMLGSPTDLLAKSKYHNLFDVMFVSSRVAQFINSEVADTILREKALVACETSKFMVPLTRDQKTEFNAKIVEYGVSTGWKSVAPPVPRRYREANDSVTDVQFFVKGKYE